MTRKPSMKQSEWIAKRMIEGTHPDDVFDVLTGQITSPTSFVADVEYWSAEYDEELRRNNAK